MRLGDHRRQRIVDLVRHACRDLTRRRESRRPCQPRLGLAQIEQAGFQLGQDAAHFQRPARPAAQKQQRFQIERGIGRGLGMGQTQQPDRAWRACISGTLTHVPAKVSKPGSVDRVDVSAARLSITTGRFDCSPSAKTGTASRIRLPDELIVSGESAGFHHAQPHRPSTSTIRARSYGIICFNCSIISRRVVFKLDRSRQCFSRPAQRLGGSSAAGAPLLPTVPARPASH